MASSTGRIKRMMLARNMLLRRGIEPLNIKF